MGERYDADVALTRALAERDAERSSKDRAYDERNQLVALIAALYPSALSRHPDADTSWEDDWRWIVFINLPTGQATWHIHDSHLSMFAHVKRETRIWDGHTTEEKYRRVIRLCNIRAAQRSYSWGGEHGEP